jgi:hypothetical protein
MKYIKTQTELNEAQENLNISDDSDSDDIRITGFRRIEKLIDELENHKYFRGNETWDIGNDIGKIIQKYFTKDDNIEVFIDGLKHGISVADGSHF